MDLRTYYTGEKENALYSWIALVVDKNLPFTAVEDETHRAASKHKPISYKTLLKYVGKLADQVKKDLKSILPPHFGLIFDGWTHKRLHIVAIFAEFGFYM